MAGFNGSGTYIRDYDWTTDAADEIPIQSDRMDTEDDGFAAALSMCILKDGQQTITANIPWGGFKITGLGDATLATDAVNRQTGDARWHPIGATTTTDNAVARYNGTAGATQNSAVIIDDSNNVTGVVDLAASTIHTTGTGVGNQISAQSTDAGASVWPAILLDRFSATPAASDNLASIVFRGRDNAANTADYVKIKSAILDTTDTSEDGQGILAALVAGADTNILTWGPGVQIGAPTGGDKGAGTLNVASGLWLNGTQVVIPGTTVDNTIPRFDGVSGAMQTSSIVISDANRITDLTGISASNTDTTTTFTATSTDAGAGTFVGLLLDRQSASPAASDALSDIRWRGRDSGGNVTDYATAQTQIVVATDGSEAARWLLKVFIAGTSTTAIQADSSGVALLGTNTNDSASAGFVGESVSATVPAGSAVSMTTGTDANITSISLTAGDWDVAGLVAFDTTSTTDFTTLAGGVSRTSATLPAAADLTQGSFVYRKAAGNIGSNGDIMFAVPQSRMSLSSTTTVYLVATASFTASTCAGYGYIVARRRR